VPFEPSPNVTIHALKSRLGPLSPLVAHQTGQVWLKPRLRHLLDEGGYDVIHFHNASLIGFGAFKYGRAVKLYTMHEHWLVCPMHILWKHDREVCTSQSCVTCTIAGGRPPQWWRFTSALDRAAANIDQFLAPSKFVRDKHREFGFDHPTTVLPYFVPTPDDSPDGPRPHARPYFLFVGRLVKVKGAQTLFDTFRRYADADLLIAGEGEYGDTLRAAAADIPNVKFLGVQSYDRLRTLYRHAIGLIVPSICFEAVAIVTLESIAEGTPVIVRQIGGMPETVAASEAGLVFQTDAELLAALHRMQHEPGLRETLSANGLRNVERNWGVDEHMRRYFEIIETHRRR
jgi:glycosyltransferase involved in cell wall biosynthesis